MKIVGLITEYNPFHNGHKYHIEKAREITGADYVIAVMSGDFVQRGAPAFLPKHLRTSMALDGGCDMVIELPVFYATGSAEFFAKGAVSILDNLGCVDTICFGSECGDYDSLEKVAEILAWEPDEYKSLLHENLKKGHNFPVSRKNALKEYLKSPKLYNIIEEPNNILGIEYIKQLILLNSHINGCTIQRADSSYHDEELSELYSSASSIRNILLSDSIPDFDKLQDHVSDYTLNLLKKDYRVRYPVLSDDFSLILRCKLLSETKESLIRYRDVTPDLANRIINFRNDYLSFSQFCQLLKTKELTYTRISRCLMHIVLNIKTEHPVSYARILGFRQESSDLFSIIKTASKIPVISKVKVSDFSDTDIYASDLYESVISHKYNKPFINEFTKSIVKI